MLDSLYSTNVTKLIKFVDLAKQICEIDDIALHLKNYDPKLVSEIAKLSDNKKIFSFATKYCCMHNYYVYDRDDYSIVDISVKKLLPKYYN